MASEHLRRFEQGQPAQVELLLALDGIVVDVEPDHAVQSLCDSIAVGEPLPVHALERSFFECNRRWIAEEDERRGTINLKLNDRDGRTCRAVARLSNQGDGYVRVSLWADELSTARLAESQMRRAVEGSRQGIVVITATEILYMNDGYAHLLGYASGKELMSVHTTLTEEYIHPDDRQMIRERIEARVAGLPVPESYEYRLIRRDGSPCWVSVTAARVNWDGKSASLSWITDISARKQIEEELIKSKEAAEFASRSKTEFLANMSHELRTPLNAIIGFSEVIQTAMFGPVPQRYVEYAHDIHTSGLHLLDLINDILNLSKIEAGKLELHESLVSVKDAVEECYALLRGSAEKGSVGLRLHTDDGNCLLRADPRAVKQILLNFLSNAVKFTPAGGEVVTNVDVDGQGRMRVSVSDTGIGMSAADIKIALTPFGQIDSRIARKHQGTGLGLPLAKSLLDLHDGKLLIASEPNKGTTLIALFPSGRVRHAANSAQA
ncbi:MAG TPA: ATP-binding protein [Rhizomicrobium sp.]|nr:ATP-binding protein [Rhizomicrobium sp.]